jgi:hypothetical protein
MSGTTKAKIIFGIIGVILSAIIITRAVHWIMGMLIPVAVVGAIGIGGYLYLNSRRRALTDSRKNLP